MWTIWSPDGRLRIDPDTGDAHADAPAADAALRTDPETLNALLHDPDALDGAVRAGAVQIDGDRAALRELLGVFRRIS